MILDDRPNSPWYLGGLTATAMSTIPPPTAENFSWLAWVIGMASSAAIFFLAWGLKDVKSRYDRVPTLEAEISSLEGKIRRLCAELGKRYEDC